METINPINVMMSIEKRYDSIGLRRKPADRVGGEAHAAPTAE
jgi:hypothetical protein